METRIDERLGQVRADERKIRQVVLNLLSNAIKFTPEGGRIDVTARLSEESVEISVTDTGIGIAPEDQEAVFEEFRQVGRPDKKAEGTGLGLTLCRKFIELASCVDACGTPQSVAIARAAPPQYGDPTLASSPRYVWRSEPRPARGSAHEMSPMPAGEPTQDEILSRSYPEDHRGGATGAVYRGQWRR